MKNINEWVDELSNQNNLIIVEGKKDKIALNKLGIENISILNKSISNFLDPIITENKEVIILTDLDKEGRKLYSRIKKELERNKVKVNDKYRKYLFKLKISHIQGLFTYYKNHSREVL